MAIVHDKQGQYGEALELHKQSLAIKLKVHGPDHPDVSLRALRNAARQGVGFVLTVGDEIGEYINEGAAAWLGARAERVFHEATTVHEACPAWCVSLWRMRDAGRLHPSTEEI